MKNLTLGIAAFALAAPLAWSALQEPSSEYSGPLWEYKVVGMTEIHGRSLDYLMDALEGGDEDEGLAQGLMRLAKRADDQMAKKSEDLLNELGREGWELVESEVKHLILKRPLR